MSALGRARRGKSRHALSARSLLRLLQQSPDPRVRRWARRLLLGSDLVAREECRE